MEWIQVKAPVQLTLTFLYSNTTATNGGEAEMVSIRAFDWTKK